MSDPTSSPRDGHASGSHYQPSLAVVLIIIVLFVGGTFLMVRAISPSSSTPTTTTTVPTTSTTAPPSTTRVIKSRTRVQVANGTNVTNLAATFTQKLMTQDWDTLPPGNGPHEALTIIYYLPGQLAAAQEVAATIKVSSSAIHPLGHLTPVAGASGDDVIVILGNNSAPK